MQEFTWPGRTAETELGSDLEKAALRREFEQRLEECGTLAFRIARAFGKGVEEVFIWEKPEEQSDTSDDVLLNL